MIIILCLFSTQAVMAMDNDVSNNMTVSKNDISINQVDSSLLLNIAIITKKYLNLRRKN